MEIRIKAAEGFHDSGVTIEIRADDAAEAGEVGKRIYDPEKAAETMAENYQRARTRITELERLAAREIETRRAEAARAREFDLDRKSERDRSARLSAELQTAKGVLDKAVASARADERALWEDRLATEQRLRREDAARWARVQELLYSTAVKQAIRTEHSPGAIALGNAIRDVRRILDEPAGADERALWEDAARWARVRKLIDDPEVDDHLPHADNTDAVALYEVIGKIREVLDEPESTSSAT